MYLTLLAFLGIVAAIKAGPQDPGGAIDIQRSSITIHVGKSGLFAAAAHEHWVDASIASGTIDAAGVTPSVRFRVDARKVSVRPEQGVSDKDRAEVQANMQHKVLESSIYPEIVFQSTHVQRNGDNVWKVSGDMTLHGVTKSLTFDVARESGAYAGTVRVKQTNFGIQPIKIGGGVVKVKDELEISFSRVHAGSLMDYAASRNVGSTLSRTLSSPRSAASWQRMQNGVHGTASRRRLPISLPQ